MLKRGGQAFLLALVAAIAFVGPVRGAAEERGERPKSGRTVIPGTWTWDIETDALGGNDADVWWQVATEEEKYLTPTNGTRLAVVAGRAYNDLKGADLKEVAYSDARIAIGDLKPGTILALRTKAGDHAKLKVVGYRDMHDLSFKEARHLDEGWKAFIKSRPNNKDYHIEITWELFAK